MHYCQKNMISKTKEYSTENDMCLDKEVKEIVDILRGEGVETIQSCSGKPGHPLPECTVTFCGGQAEGLRALSVALQRGLPVWSLYRTWDIVDKEITGPLWKLVFNLKEVQRLFCHGEAKFLKSGGKK